MTVQKTNRRCTDAPVVRWHFILVSTGSYGAQGCRSWLEKIVSLLAQALEM